MPTLTPLDEPTSPPGDKPPSQKWESPLQEDPSAGPSAGGGDGGMADLTSAFAASLAGGGGA